jgi:hypothetical protein
MSLICTADALEYGLNGQNTSNSTFGGRFLQPPILNISAPFLERDPSRSERFIGQSRPDFHPIDDKSKVLWGYDDRTYHLDYMAKHGQCQAVSVCGPLAVSSAAD